MRRRRRLTRAPFFYKISGGLGRHGNRLFRIRRPNVAGCVSHSFDAQHCVLFCINTFEKLKNIFFSFLFLKFLEGKPVTLPNRAAGKTPTQQLDPKMCKVHALPASLWKQVRIKRNSPGFSLLLRTSP